MDEFSINRSSSYSGNLQIRVNRQFQRHKKEQEVIWKFADALWQWREVKEQTDNVDLAIEREFLFDETALATKVTIEDPPQKPEFSFRKLQRR